MYNVHKSCIICYLMLFIVSGAVAQKNPVHQEMERHKHPDSESRLKKVGIENKYAAEALTDLGYDDSTVTKLQEVGVDLPKFFKDSPWWWEEKIKAALSDCIIIGTVSRIEHLDDKLPFRTMAYVEVEEFLRNDYRLPKGQIPVMIESGLKSIVIGEDTLETGEHVMLFLSASSLIRYGYHNHRDYYNQLINDSTIRFRIFGVSAGKYLIKNGKVVNHERKRDLNEVKDEIKAIVTALHREPSTMK